MSPDYYKYPKTAKVGTKKTSWTEFRRTWIRVICHLPRSWFMKQDQSPGFDAFAVAFTAFALILSAESEEQIRREKVDGGSEPGAAELRKDSFRKTSTPAKYQAPLPEKASKADNDEQADKGEDFDGSNSEAGVDDITPWSTIYTPSTSTTGPENQSGDAIPQSSYFLLDVNTGPPAYESVEIQEECKCIE